MSIGAIFVERATCLEVCRRERPLHHKDSAFYHLVKRILVVNSSNWQRHRIILYSKLLVDVCGVSS